jgi:Protein of unknown function (DUF3618)
MGQDPSQIRNDIEETRSRMGDTAEALGHKADVPGRAREAISDKVDGVKSTFSGASPQQAVGIAKENPLGLAIGAAAVGFVAGLVIPSTAVEDERIGPMADQVKQEAKERGKHVAEQAAQTAKEEGQKQAQEMAPTSS